MIPTHVFGNSSQETINHHPVTIGQDDMRGMLDATFDASSPIFNDNSELPTQAEATESFDMSIGVSDDTETAKYKKLLKSASDELYNGCSSFSKLSFLLNLLHLKSTFKWSSVSFNALLSLLLDAFPQMKEFPLSYYESKRVIKDWVVEYEKIDACPNSCMLYWGDLSKLNSCPTCKASRWRRVKGQEDYIVDDNDRVERGIPAKPMRYFPIIPRLIRVYKTPETDENMIWYHRDRVKDAKLRHSADALAWKDFDVRFPDFASELRNVRLGLASDGFNPYRPMSTTYSTWHVVLINYNLSPWLVMKPSSFILSMIIPGKSSPYNNIDVYLQPLMHELKQLWEGVEVFDAYKKEWFKMRVALTSTINDFPTYAMLSGWSTKGYKACTVCTDSTNSYMFAGKICYCGFRKWLADDHPYWSQADLFDGTEKYNHAPERASGRKF